VTSATRPLDLADIQGNVLRGYRFPVATHRFYHVRDVVRARDTIRALIPRVTHSEDEHHDGGCWSDGVKPRSALNIAFTWRGLEAIGVPQSALWAFPEEFRAGMQARARVLVDLDRSAPEHWESMWRDAQVHVVVMLMANSPTSLEDRLHELQAVVHEYDGLVEVGSQDAQMESVGGKMREHFGYLDGFGNPEIEGAPGTMRPGRGKLAGKSGWAPLAAGEFVLGQRNEAGEVAPTPQPSMLFRNGTFMVYRKLHQNVATFRRFLKEEGARFSGGPELLAAKLMGRWMDGTPIMHSPDHPDAELAADNMRNTDFRYSGDPHGAVCPLGAHIRRANPRDAIGFDGVTVNRRRMIRRGLPYGAYTPPDEPGDDRRSQGLLFIAFVASISEQFEFVQQQWMNYGNDFALGNDKDTVVGVRTSDRDRLLIPGDPARSDRRPTHFCFSLPQFVETRGGEYFFLPSLAGLGVIAGPSTSSSSETR
jgi:Dyp-type peroxidase family